MNWNVEIGKQISMVILVIMMILIVIRYRKIEKVNFFFFAGYILLSLNDFFFYYYHKLTSLSTERFYTICITIVFFLYLLYYMKLLSAQVLKKIQFFILVCFVLSILAMSYVDKSLFEHFSFNMLYINILLLTFSILLFLYQTFNSDKIFEIKNYLPFWISVGLLIFYIGIIPIFYFRTSVSQDIYFFILFLLNLISNIIIAIGLFWTKQDKIKQVRF